MSFWDNIRYFKPSEFDSPDAPGTGYHMDEDFVLLLDALREAVGFPLRINSGFRTKEHNKLVGGKPTSAHTKSVAVDTRCVSAHYRFRILEEAYRLGFRRIGIGETFIHLDSDLSLPQEVLWTYPSSETPRR